MYSSEESAFARPLGEGGEDLQIPDPSKGYRKNASESSMTAAALAQAFTFRKLPLKRWGVQFIWYQTATSS